MLALKLTYHPKPPTLKVVKGFFFSKEKSCAGCYRFGFNGMERDNEVKGVGNSYTTLFRQLDTRLGKWLTIDPKATAWESPYVSMGNNPIWFNDPFGDSTNFVNEDGTVVADLDDGSNTVFVIGKDKNDELIKQISANFAFKDIKVDDAAENEKLGNKYGVSIEEYGSKWDDLYEGDEPKPTYFEEGYNNGYEGESTPWHITILRVEEK